MVINSEVCNATHHIRVIVSEVCKSGGMQAFLHGGRSLIILENLWRGLYWILKTSLSPKDQRELFVPFSKVFYGHTNKTVHLQISSYFIRYNQPHQRNFMA